MRIIHTAERAVAIWFIGEAPPPPKKSLALVRGALRSAGLSPWPRTEAELFTRGGEALFIARPGR